MQLNNSKSIDCDELNINIKKYAYIFYLFICQKIIYLC